MNDDSADKDYLRRLPPEAYRGLAHVHWTQTIEKRRTGWLNEPFHLRFREVLVHAAFRYHLTIPVYCLMQDHFHMVVIGNHPRDSDQRVAMKWIRKQVNWILGRIGGREDEFPLRLQKQAYDNVLRERDRERSAFARVCDYVRENPRRAGLIDENADYRVWPYSGCVIPGYPEVRRNELKNDEFWDLFWRLHYRRVEENEAD